MGRSDRPVPVGAYLLIVLGSSAYFLFAFAWFSLPAYLTPVIVDLGLTSTQAGIVTGAVQLSYIPFSLLSGLAIDRIGAHKAIGIGMLIVGVAHAIRSGSTDFLTILLPTILFGIGGTALTFGLPKLVAQLFPPEMSGTMSSVYIVGPTLGAASAFAIGRPLVGPLFGGWRGFFLYSGGFMVAGALVWLFVVRFLWNEVPKYESESNSQSFSLASLRDDVGAVVSHRGLLLLVVIGTMQLMINHGLRGWIQTILVSRGAAVAIAGSITSAFILTRIVGVATIPYLTDRYEARRVGIIGSGIIAVAGSLLLVLSGGTLLLAIGSLVLIGLGLGGISTLVRAIPIEMEGIGPDLTASANALIFTVGQAGGFFGPFLIGFLQDVTGGYQPSLFVFVIASAVIVGAGVVMEEPSRA